MSPFERTALTEALQSRTFSAPHLELIELALARHPDALRQDGSWPLPMSDVKRILGIRKYLRSQSGDAERLAALKPHFDRLSAVFLNFSPQSDELYFTLKRDFRAEISMRALKLKMLSEKG